MRPAQKQRFELALALSSPLIHGPQTKCIAELIGYSKRIAKDLARGRIVPFEPRDSFYLRLKRKLRVYQFVQKIKDSIKWLFVKR